MKKKLHSALRSRRGISIAETLISLVIVVIVSVAAVSLMAATTRVEGDLVHTAQINEYAESAVECFRWADDDEEFEEAIAVLGFQKTGAEGNECLYKLERSFCNVEIRTTTRNILDVSLVLDTLKFTAKDEKGDVIYGFTYEK